MAPRPPHTTISVTTEVTPALGRQARQLLGRSVPGHLLDDRFDAWSEGAPSPNGFCAALVSIPVPEDTPIDGPAPVDRVPAYESQDIDDATDPAESLPREPIDYEVVGYLGGGVSRDRLQLDGLIDPTAGDVDALADQLMAALTPAMARSGAKRVELWGRPAQAWHEALAGRQGLAPVRALHQMRCPLPINDLAPLPSRPYEPGDLAGLVEVNNRAFATHPDQGGQTAASFEAVMAESWFRPEGLRIYEREGRLAGFCWTKVHDDPEPSRQLGEIYVIGIDPDFHGQGLGAPMTAAGLAWLHDQGLTTGMLYVEAENEPAVRTYRRLGFSVARTDRAWGQELAGP